MKKFFLKINQWSLKLAVLVVLLLPEFASAQFFTYNEGDLLLGFRRTVGASSYDLVVNLGSVTNYLALPAGTSLPISQFSPSRLSDAFNNNYNNLSWSLSAAAASFGNWSGFPAGTYWITVPRANPIVQSTPPQRNTASQQNLTLNQMASIGTDAAQMSQQFIQTTGPDNTTNLVRELTGGNYDGFDYHYFVQDPQMTSLGDFRGTLPFNAENMTPAVFTNVVTVSDLYQSVPSASGGAAVYIGFFALTADGTMTFTRASTTPPPLPQIKSLTRVGNTTTISFTTANGAVYALMGSNSTGLTIPVANLLPQASLVGDGLTNSLSETTSASSQFYLIGAGN